MLASYAGARIPPLDLATWEAATAKDILRILRFLDILHLNVIVNIVRAAAQSQLLHQKARPATVIINSSGHALERSSDAVMTIILIAGSPTKVNLAASWAAVTAGDINC
jgi:hypothetical protein